MSKPVLNVVREEPPIPCSEEGIKEILNQFLLGKSGELGEKDEDGDCYHLKFKDRVCEVCLNKCDSTKIKIFNNFIYYSCNKMKEDKCVGTIPIDVNILNNINVKSLCYLVYELEKYYNQGDKGTMEFIVKCLGNIMRTNGNIIYIYNGTTRLWTSCNSFDHAAYIISHYLDSIVTEFKRKSLSIKKNLQENGGSIVDIEQTNKIINICNYFHGISAKMSKMTKLVKTCVHMITPMYSPSGISCYFPIRGCKVVDLKTGKVSLRSLDHFFKVESRYSYLGKKYPCPNMDRFMVSLFNGNEEVEYMQKFLGYCLTGEVDDRAYYILWGHGHNGKSVLLEIMSRILSIFHCNLMPSALTGKHGNGATPELVPLIGARLASISELAPGEKLNTSLVKRLTSGDDKITVRPLYGTPIEFENKAKLVMVTNHPPELSLDNAIAERTRFIPFINKFIDKEIYDDLEDKTNFGIKDQAFVDDLRQNHMDEVFTYIVNGAIKYYQEGLKVPKSFEKACNDYLDEQDNIKTFINERCEKNAAFKIRSKDLLESYNSWASNNDCSQLNCRTIKKEMEQRGYKYKKIKEMYVIGLKVTPEELEFIGKSNPKYDGIIDNVPNVDSDEDIANV